MAQRVLLLLCGAILLQGFLGLAQEIPNDIGRSGAYTIQLCRTRTPQVQTALNRLRTALQPAIQDTRSTTSSAAFRSFFKTRRNSPHVRRVLSDIAAGTALPSIASRIPSAPKFACVTAPGLVRFQVKGEFRDIYDDCKKNPLWVAIYYSGLNYIFICNPFFSPTIPAKPASKCPKVNAERNEFVGDLNALIQFKPYVLLHELAHFYAVPPSTENLQYEVYDWNAAFKLKARRAILNAQSYVLYVASVAAGCTAFPSTAVPHSRGRRLGEDAYLPNVGHIGGLWGNWSTSMNNTALWLDDMRVI